MRCDLHLHSTASDGRIPPTGVVKEARNAGLDLIALTDHDTLAGIPEALAEAQRVIPSPKILWGTEITSSLDGRELHVLGYFAEQPSEAFEAELARARQARRERVLEGLSRVRQRFHIEITAAEVERQAGDEVLSRAHVADALVARGVARNRRAAFRNYLEDRHGLFPHTRLHPGEACAAIRAAGGVSVWAHPPHREFLRTLDVLEPLGLDGVETTTRGGGHDKKLDRIVRDRGLLPSGGSDWHGYGAPPSRGRWHVPSERIQDLLARLGISTS